MAELTAEQAKVDAYLGNLEMTYDEVKLVFEGLAQEHLWKRPTEQLLSIGELAAHVAYCEAIMLAGEAGDPHPDLDKCQVSGVFMDHRFMYYTISLETPPTEQHLGMTVAQVQEELLRVHTESVAALRRLSPSLKDHAPGWPGHHDFEWALKYAVFHVSYHTGQMYSVRHLLGEVPPDN